MHIEKARLITSTVLGAGHGGAHMARMMRVPLLHAQNRLCGICGTNLHSGGPLNTDHVWPKAEGGFDGPGNIVLAHMACNDRKGKRLPTGCEIIALVAVCARLWIPVQLKPGLRF